MTQSDLNVWLALVVAEHPHHVAARRYWDDGAAARALGQKLHFCRHTCSVWLRLLANLLMGKGVLAPTQALAIYRQLRDTDGVAFCADSSPPIRCCRHGPATLPDPARAALVPTRGWRRWPSRAAFGL